MSTKNSNLGLLAAVLVAAATISAVATPAAASAAAQPRVVGGSPTDVSHYPWQAALVYSGSRYSGNDAQRQLCGAVLVAPRIALTAAHCIVNTDRDLLGGDLDPNDADLVLNETTLSNGDGEHHALQAIQVQPDYNPTANTNDVAYLVLATPSSQQPIKLVGPTETALMAPSYPTEVSGYGVLDPSSSTGSNTLRAATVPIIGDSTCSGEYGSDFVAGAMVCAGYVSGGIDSCFGDSGGPLQAPAQGGVYRLAGLVSFGEGPTGCADSGFPGVYSRVGASPPSWLFQAVVNEVATVESQQGLAHTDIVGSGALPLGTPAAEKKCKKHRKLNKKTGKCVKKKKHNKKRKRA
jgi:secreted trypsin-like serine protease